MKTIIKGKVNKLHKKGSVVKPHILDSIFAKKPYLQKKKIHLAKIKQNNRYITIFRKVTTAKGPVL